MKKFLSALLAAILLITCFGVSALAVPSGDIDKNGKVGADDARKALRYSVKLENLSEIEVKRADMNGDGAITSEDARLILRKSVGFRDAWLNIPAEKTLFERQLFARARQFITFDENGNKVGATKPYFPTAFQKWCCIYTIDDVFRPTLQACGYSKQTIDNVCPEYYSKESILKAWRNVSGLSAWPEWFISSALFTYPVPSMFMDYYIKNPNVCKVFFLHEYYDDIVEAKVYPAVETDILSYEPKIGDILFMSNKNTTNVNGYLTIDHTAQIIEIAENGDFRCTEGSIVVSSEGDNRARVRERVYEFDDELGTYAWQGNHGIVVTTIVRPKLS